MNIQGIAKTLLVDAVRGIISAGLALAGVPVTDSERVGSAVANVVDAVLNHESISEAEASAERAAAAAAVNAALDKLNPEPP